MLNELSIKLKLWKMGYPLLPIKEESLNLYKRAVKNNSNESDFLARCKLSRNWYCSTKEKAIGNVTWRYYGNLAIGMRENERLRKELNQLKVKEVEKQQTQFGVGIND